MMMHLVLLAALIHVYIFVLESFLFGKPRTNAVFGLKPEDVEPARSWAFNQGWYNLLLALAIFAGWGLVVFCPELRDCVLIGKTLAAYGLASILVAGLVLLISAPQLLRSALIQIVPAVLGFVGVWLA